MKSEWERNEQQMATKTSIKSTGKREDVTSDEDEEAASTGTNASESNEGSKIPRNSMKQAS